VSKRAVLSPDAQRDIRNIMAWSNDKFGVEAARRYRTLLIQVLKDISDDPLRPGSKERPEIMAQGVRTYHFFFSRDRVTCQPVKEPRHFVLYRRGRNGGVEVARILHDSRDLVRHLPEDYKR